jgi:hypothetical protein
MESAMNQSFKFLASLAVTSALFASSAAHAITTTFFDATQVATHVASGTTSETVSSQGYLFTYTMDTLFTGGYGMTVPIGRPVAVAWPTGVEAQAVTTGPVGPAQITIKRVDGTIFDVSAFTAKLLANTAATGAAIEVMPKLNGEDGLNNPLAFDASGYYGMSFAYGSGSTGLLHGFDSYTFSLFTDFALTSLTLVDASPAATVPEPGNYAMFLTGMGFIAALIRRRITFSAA